MTDLDDVLARIGLQIEELKKRIRSSGNRAEQHRAEVQEQDASNRVRPSDQQTLREDEKNRQDRAVAVTSK
jgi:hypothetical protein